MEHFFLSLYLRRYRPDPEPRRLSDRSPARRHSGRAQGAAGSGILAGHEPDEGLHHHNHAGRSPIGPLRLQERGYPVHQRNCGGRSDHGYRSLEGRERDGLQVIRSPDAAAHGRRAILADSAVYPVLFQQCRTKVGIPHMNAERRLAFHTLRLRHGP